VGRFESADATHLYALWAYDDQAAFEEVDRLVRHDPDSAAALEARRLLDPLFTDRSDEFLTSTVPLSVTELAHLEAQGSTRQG
jgi:hypothetical protein